MLGGKKTQKKTNPTRFGFRIEISEFQEDPMERFFSAVSMHSVVLPGEAIFGRKMKSMLKNGFFLQNSTFLKVVTGVQNCRQTPWEYSPPVPGPKTVVLDRFCGTSGKTAKIIRKKIPIILA